MRRVANAQCLDHYLVLACRVVSLDEVLDQVHSRNAGRDLGRVDVHVYQWAGLVACSPDAISVIVARRRSPDELGILRGHGVYPRQLSSWRC